MSRDPKVKVVITIDGKEYIAGIDQAIQATQNFNEASERTAATVNHLAGAVKAAAAGFLGWQLAGLVRDVVDVNAEFDRLQASLETITGTGEAAQVALDQIAQFAQETPYQLQEVVGAFIKLKALGLDPSMEALRSYGNTASAMGKSLDQMIEAVADAATGEFERLKEFGIKASVQGDQVAFRFRGVTTVVRNTAADIEAYLQRIGEVEFAGGMARQMDTIGGKISNLEDAVAKLARTIGEDTGLNGALKRSIEQLTEWVGRLSGARRPIDEIEADIAALEARMDRLAGRQAARQGAGAMRRRLRELQTELAVALGASGDPRQIQRGLAILDAQIAEMDRIESRLDGADGRSRRRRGRNGVVRRIQRDNDDLARLIEQRNQLLRRLAVSQRPADAPEAGGESETPMQSRSRADQVEARLRRELALYGAVGEAAKIRYEIEQGSLKDLSAEQKARLLDLAEELDFRRADEAAIREAIETQNEAIEAERRWQEVRRARASAAVDALQRQLMTERELEQQRYQQALAELELAEQLKIDTLVDYQTLRERLAAEHERRITEIERQEAQRRFRIQQQAMTTVAGLFGNLSRVVGNNTKKQFKLAQRLARLEVILNTASAAMAAYKSMVGIPIVGQALAVTAAASAIAAGAAQLRAINSTTWESAKGVTGTFQASANTGLPAPTSDPYATTARAGSGGTSGTTVIQITGRDTDTITMAQMDQIFEQLEDALARGDKVLFRRDSAQALELIGS